MKEFILSISLTLFAATSFGQWFDDANYYMNFEDTFVLEHLRIDTLTNENNLWQVGSPQKTIFTSALSLPNAIVTDTIYSYPTNDTSSFIIVNVADLGFELSQFVILAGEYNVNSDTLTDYGTIEFSPDKGTTWIDLLNDTIYYSLFFTWYPSKPVLTGNSNGWHYFEAGLAGFGSAFNIQYGDTILYRFTFISDSIQTNKDGLMFDDFHFEDIAEGIAEIENDNLISIYPNPVKDQLSIKTNQTSSSPSIQIINYQGEILYDHKNFHGDLINTHDLINGLYFLRYSDTKSFSIKKFVVSH
jgi:hypothetical protein